MMSILCDRWMKRRWCKSVRVCLMLVCSLTAASAQQQKLVNCKPAAERTQAEGCWIVASKPLGTLTAGTVFWTLDTYPTRESAERARTSQGAVVEALGKIWLLTVGEKPAPPSQGTRVTQIGPLPVKENEAYTAQFMESILEPGAVSRTHVHAGPEAFYTESGESCLETPGGKQIGRKGLDIVVPEGMPMELVATGNETRRSIVLVLHSSTKPATTVVVDWKSKGLCMSAK